MDHYFVLVKQQLTCKLLAARLKKILCLLFGLEAKKFYNFETDHYFSLAKSN